MRKCDHPAENIFHSDFEIVELLQFSVKNYPNTDHLELSVITLEDTYTN